MLYISRRIDSDNFGVVDTDDGVETICSPVNIYYACIMCDVDIKGVVLTEDGKYVERIAPYNAESTLKQAKTLMLQGVSIVVCNGAIVDISVPTSKLGSPRVDIVLSEYAKSCGSCITQTLVLADDYELRFVLDDSVTIKPDTFSRVVYRKGIFIDITAVRRVDTLNSVYGVDCDLYYDSILNHIIDVSWRIKDYKGVDLVRHEPGGLVQAKQYDKLASAKVEAIFFDEFMELFQSRIKIGRTKKAKRAHEEFVSASTLKTFSYYISQGTVTYKDAANFANTICTWMARATNLDSRRVCMLLRYIRWFCPTLAFRKEYVKYCIRVVETYKKE